MSEFANNQEHIWKLQGALEAFREATGQVVSVTVGGDPRHHENTGKIQAYLTAQEADDLIALRKRHAIAEQKGAKIALDYDNTYTVDPGFWDVVIGLAKNAGHDIRIVTARDERYDRTPALIEVEQIAQVIYCRGVAKRWYLSHFGDGFVPDIWIDDKPESISENSRFAPDKLAEWRANRQGEEGCK